MSEDLKKKQDQELRAYMKRYMVTHTAAAAVGLISTAVIGYIGKKLELYKKQ